MVAAYGICPHVGQSLDGFSFSLCSTLCPCISFRQEQFWVKILRVMDSPILQPGAMPNLWIWSLQVLPPLCGVLQLMSSLWGPGRLLLSWHLGLSGCYPQFLIPHCYTPLFNFLTSVHLLYLLPYLILPLFFPSPSSLPPKFLPPSTSLDYIVPTSKWN